MVPSNDLQSLIAELEAKKNTLILFHRSPDGDAVGSAFALKLILKELGSNAFCLCESEVPQRLAFLLSGQTTVTVIPDGFLPERIISVDTASTQQMGKLAELYADKVDWMIDHHEAGTPYAKNSVVDAKASATGEILTVLLQVLTLSGKITPTKEIRERLYSAISSDTGCFRYSCATESTHRLTAFLMAGGLCTAEINRLLFEVKTKNQLKAESAGIRALRTVFDGRVAVIPFPYELKTELHLADSDLECLVDIGRSLAGVSVSASVRQPENKGVFRVSLRSNGKCKVSDIAVKFGGGGHEKAAGCTIEARNMDEAVTKLLTVLQESGI